MNTTVRAAELTALLSEAPTDATDHDAIRKFIHQMAEAGLAVMFVLPGSKVPADMRSPRQRTADDRAAQAAARVKSPSGLALATTDVHVLDGYLDRYIAVFASKYPEGVPVSLAVETGGSGLVVVDCDTAAQMQRWADAAEIAPGTQRPPTVITPGHMGDGADPDDPATWAHADGGHFWFTVPEGVELPSNIGAMTIGGDDDGFAVLWNSRYVLIPPSERPEGVYAVAGGGVSEAPRWLLEQIIDHARLRSERAAQRREHASVSGDAVAAWGATITWAEILAPTDWLSTGKADGCGCVIWTAPGQHASPKSATAHEPGCAVADSDDPCLHIWTDHDIDPFGPVVAEHGSHLTRLRAVAAIHTHNDIGAAMTALDLTGGDALAVDLPADFGRARSEDDAADTDDSVPGGVTLPASFWEARESLTHIRDAALKNRAAPDATLASVLTRIAAWTPPQVAVDTGIMSPVSLNFYSAAVSWSGKGKTSAMEAAEKVLELVPGWSTDPMHANDCPVVVPDGEKFPRVGKIRSGEGIAEMYWGEVSVMGANNKPSRIRRRVRSNVLMHTDEAASLVKYILDPKQTVGETLREAWSNQHTGQSNADGARYRFVERGTYRLGLIVGFHLSVFAEILTPEQTLLGTPQRFYAAWSKPDPTQVSRDMLMTLTDPGPLRVVIPMTGMRLCQALRGLVDEQRISEWLRDDSNDTEPDPSSQRVAMVARLAGLLAILDGRTATDELGLLVITEDDWHLAETMFETSLAIAALAVTDRRRRQARAKQEVRRRTLMETIEDEDARSSPVGRAEARIVGYLTGMGKVKWSGKAGVRDQNFNGEHAKHAETALAGLITKGRVRESSGPRRSKYVELVK